MIQDILMNNKQTKKSELLIMNKKKLILAIRLLHFAIIPYVVHGCNVYFYVLPT